MNELTTVLEAEARELRRLGPLLEAQEAALKHADTGALASTLRDQEVVLRALALLECERRTHVARLAETLGESPEALTLSRLLAHVPDAPAALRALRRDLAELLERLRAIAARNRFLIDRSLVYLERLLSCLGSSLALGPAQTYAASGRAPAVMPRLRLVDREV